MFVCPMILKTPIFSIPRTVSSLPFTALAKTSSLSRSGPMILTELSPLMPESASMTLSRMFCEKLKSTPGTIASSSAFMSFTSSGLVRAHRSVQPTPPACIFNVFGPLLLGTYGNEQLDVVEPGGVCAIVRTADLHDGRFHFVVGGQDVPHHVGPLRHLLEGDIERERASDPEVALFQLGHEFVSQSWDI